MTTPLLVAVIGSGIGAASTSYFLRKALEEEVSIRVYEKEPALSGRTRSVVVDGRTIELGASIAYTGNLYVRQLVKAAGLTERSGGGNEDATFAIWNGKRFVFKESHYTWHTLAAMLWRYGGDLFRLRDQVKATLVNFDQIYTKQDNGEVFRHSVDLWKSLSLYDLTQVSFQEFADTRLSKGSLLANEFLAGINRVNYNQGNQINALAGLVSMCPMVTGTVFSVAEGNQEISRRIFAQCNVSTQTSVEVTKIQSFEQNGVRKYRVFAGPNVLGEFDSVVLAAPIEASRIQIELDGKIVDNIPRRRYQDVYTTFIRGKLNKDAFRKARGSSDPTAMLWRNLGFLYNPIERLTKPVFPDAILLTENARSSFNSLTRYWDDGHGQSVFKLFSTAPLDAAALDALFTKHNIIIEQSWRAYPQFSPPEQLAPFQPHEQHHVYYVNALEGAVSAMEISAIAGRNVAMLIERDVAKARAQKIAQ